MEPTTSTEVDSAALTLRAWSQRGSDDQPPLSTLISRINTQEGSFRNAREQDAVENDEAEDLSDNAPESSGEEEEEEPKSQREKVLAAREDIIKFANQALTESSHTLDFISLLLTSHNAKQASFTISPFIKQTLPNGCIGSEVVDPPKPSENKTRQNELTSFGWKLQSLSTAADSLLAAASSLEKEMEKEAKYWDQVLSVKSKGWSVFRLPVDKKTLAVRYGFLESPSGFKDKGVAALRRGEDGKVDLDLGRNAVRGSLRVRVKSQGIYVASTQNPSVPDESLEASLLQARNDLFDGELYNEMHREARSLTNRGVKCVSEGINIPLKQDVNLVVDLVEGDQPQTDLVPTDDSQLSQYPDLAATAFRLLLSYSHRQQYRRRTELPLPMKQRKRPRPLPTILQPVLVQLEHRNALADVRKHIAALEKTLSGAGVLFKLEKVEGNVDLTRFADASQKSDPSELIDDLMGTLCSSLQSTLVVKLGFNDTTPKISIRTHGNGSEFLLEYTTEGRDSVLSSYPQEAHFYDLASLEERLRQLVTLELIGAIESKYSKWEVCSPDEGLLETEPTLDGDTENLTVSLEQDELRLAWSATNEVDGEAQTAKWPPESEGPRPQSFLEEAGLMSSIRPAIGSL